MRMPNPKLFYIDTSSLMHAQHYLASRHLDKAHFTDGIRAGKIIVEAFERCRELDNLVLLKTSRLANFEMNQHFRRWLTKELFIKLKLPLEAFDGRESDLFSSYASLPEDIKQEYNLRFEEKSKWYLTWEFYDLVQVENLNSALFDIADPMQFWTPGITINDSYHLAMALFLGADYFVTGDERLKTQAEKIIREIEKTGKLPNQEPYDPALKPMLGKAFLETVKDHIK